MKNTNILLLAIAFAVSTLSNAQVIIDTFDNGMPNQLNAIDSLPPSIQSDGVNSFAVIPHGEVVRFVYEVQIPEQTSGLIVSVDLKHTFNEFGEIALSDSMTTDYSLNVYVHDTVPNFIDGWGASKGFANIIRDEEWFTYTFEIPNTTPNGNLPMNTAYVIFEIPNYFEYYYDLDYNYLTAYELQVDNVVISTLYNNEQLTDDGGLTFYTTSDVLNVLADFTASESVSYIEDSDVDGNGFVGVEDVVAMMPYYVSE